MRVTYVLPQPELTGGNKVAAQHAELLARGGFEMTMIAEGPRPRWLPFSGRFIDRSRDPVRLPGQDAVIGTFWSTLTVAEQMQLGPVAHFCQGYEGRFSHLQSEWRQIEAVYGALRPTLTVTPALGEFLAGRFGTASRVTPPVLDPFFRPHRRRRPGRRPWIAVPGVFEADFKGVATALAAVRQLRASGADCRVLRFSPLPLSETERAIIAPDRYLHHANPRDVASALAECDLLLFTSRQEEGFGLPLLEAMASGVPAVASRIPSAEFMTAGAVPLVEVDDAAGFTTSARAILDDPARWRELRLAGLQAARQFSAASVAPQLAAAIRWVAGYGSRTT